MGFEGLHETIIGDVVDTVRDGINSAETFGISIGRSRNRLDSAKSLSQATEGLILVFPHICSVNVNPETASMLTKAIETKAVSLLQIAFSAFNITNSADAVDYIKQFHTNIGSGKMSVDKFIDAMGSISTESTISRPMLVKALEEFKRMECYFEDDLNEASISNYKVVNRYGNYIVTEGNQGSEDSYSTNDTLLKPEELDDIRDEDREDKRTHDTAQRDYWANQNALQYTKQMQDDRFHQDQLDKWRREEDLANRKFNHQVDMDHADLELRSQKNAIDQAKNDFDMLTKQILPSDVKKANEMVPTMMVINFCTRDDSLQLAIRSSAVIGVKAKLYPASSDDIINKIIVKNADSNVILKLMRVSTRELNFIRDFLLAIDDAKLNAISCSTKGSDINRLLKVLERRAVKGKIRRKLGLRNAHKAITTITITKDEADFIKRYNNIDVFNVRIIRKIMELLNIMMFIIADETEECAYIIMDSGDDVYERISYTHLERESTDGSYKKAINLMTKVVR